VVLGIAVLAGGGLLLLRAIPEEKFVEYRMAEPQDAPIAIAAGTDGSVWFTIDHAQTIGRVRSRRQRLVH
jgi:virginiamycin B lyase